MTINEQERLRRCRLALGKQACQGLQGEGLQLGAGGELGLDIALNGHDQGMDSVLEALYDSERSAGLGSSSLKVARWLGDIRTYFPTPSVRIMKQDALQRLNLRVMLLEPELLE